MEPKSPRFSLSPIITTNLSRGLSSGGSSPKSALQEERYEQLFKEFSDIDKNKDNVLSFEEIHEFLSEKQGEMFDETLCRDLFNRMDKNHDQKISLEEFIESYVEVEDLIVKQIRSVSKLVKKNKNQSEDAREKLKKAEKSENLNSAGIMIGSILVVTVKSAQNLMPANSEGLADSFVEIECAGFKTNTKIFPKSLNPTWDELFSIPISNKGSELQLTVFSKSVFSDKFIGKVTIPLAVLSDQLKREQYFSLQSETQGQKWQGRICLELQWIWSRVKYFKDIIKEWENIVKEDQQKIENLKEQLEKLRKPFGLFKENNSRNDIGTPMSGTFQLEDIVANKLDEITNGKITIIIDNEGYLYFSLIFYMTMTILINFLRPDFVNVRTI